MTDTESKEVVFRIDDTPLPGETLEEQVERVRKDLQKFRKNINKIADLIQEKSWDVRLMDGARLYYPPPEGTYPEQWPLTLHRHIR